MSRCLAPEVLLFLFLKKFIYINIIYVHVLSAEKYVPIPTVSYILSSHNDSYYLFVTTCEKNLVINLIFCCPSLTPQRPNFQCWMLYIFKKPKFMLISFNKSVHASLWFYPCDCSNVLEEWNATTKTVHWKNPRISVYFPSVHIENIHIIRGFSRCTEKIWVWSADFPHVPTQKICVWSADFPTSG